MAEIWAIYEIWISVRALFYITNQMQLFAVNVIQLPGYSTCFGRFTHPSSGVQFQLYLQPPVTSSSVACTRPHWKTLAETILWFVPEAVDKLKLYSWWWMCKTPETCRVNWQSNKIDCKQLHLVGYLKA